MLEEIAKNLNSLKSQNEVLSFLEEILTESEVETLSKRWRILTMLFEGETQREIAKKLNVSLCNVTRGAKILKDEGSVVTKCLIKEKNYDKFDEITR